MNLRVHEAAEKELLSAARWYDQRQSGLGERFLDDYQAAVARIIRRYGRAGISIAVFSIGFRITWPTSS